MGFLRWAPLALYFLLGLIYVALQSLGIEAIRLHLNLIALGSFLFFFYVSYLALWKANRVQRLILSAILPFAPLPVLALLDFTGIELMTVPHAHGLTLPSTGYWLVPGLFMAQPFEFAARHLKPPDPVTPAQTYVRGAFEQPDGSLILYGSTASGEAGAERESFKLLGHIDAEGNVDKGFKPAAVDLSGVVGTFKQPDGTVLVETEAPRTLFPMIVEISSRGAVREIVRVTDYPFENQPELKFAPWGGHAPVPLLPGWLSMKPKLIRLQPDGKLDEQFNTQAAQILGEQHLGDYYAAAFDAQGRVMVACERGLLRLDGSGRLLPPGAVVFERVQLGGRKFEGLTGVAFHPDGSIFVTSGNESLDTILPRVMRFDANLKEAVAFSNAISALAPGAGQFHVLGFRRDGGVIVSLVQRMSGSRILFLGPQGNLIREISL